MTTDPDQKPYAHNAEQAEANKLARAEGVGPVSNNTARAYLKAYRSDAEAAIDAPAARVSSGHLVLPPKAHQSQLPPSENKFHLGNGSDGKHYWLTPPDLYTQLDAEFNFDFDPCPCPKPEGFDGLTSEWGQRNYVNPPFGSIMHEGKKKGPTAWMRKAIAEQRKGKLSVVVYPVDKWVLMMLAATGSQNVRNLGDVRWCATEDGSQGKGTGRHIACFILLPQNAELSVAALDAAMKEGAK